MSWSEYEGADFGYYRVVICDLDDFDRDSASCTATAFSSSFTDAGDTGPVTASGLDPYINYVVVLQLWLSGASDPLRFYWGILALEQPTPTPEPTRLNPPARDASIRKSGPPSRVRRTKQGPERERIQRRGERSYRHRDAGGGSHNRVGLLVEVRAAADFDYYRVIVCDDSQVRRRFVRRNSVPERSQLRRELHRPRECNRPGRGDRLRRDLAGVAEGRPRAR